MDQDLKLVMVWQKQYHQADICFKIINYIKKTINAKRMKLESLVSYYKTYKNFFCWIMFQLKKSDVSEFNKKDN